MITRPAAENSFEFVRVVALRAAQLMRGCTPHVPKAEKAIITAHREVAGGHIRANARPAHVAIPFVKPTFTR